MRLTTGKLYKYNPCMFDIFTVKGLTSGEIVRTIKSLIGEPPRDQIYVQNITGDTIVMVKKTSIEPIKNDGDFMFNGTKIHYQRNSPTEWEAWEDGGDDNVIVATSFDNIFAMI